MYKNTLYTLIFSLCVSLSACSSQFSSQTAPVASEGVVATSSFHNNPQLIALQAQRATGDQATTIQLQAVDQLIKQRQYPLALDLLNQLAPEKLSSDELAQQKLLYARISLAQNDPNRSLTLLQSIQDSRNLPDNLQITYLQTQAAAALQSGNILTSVKTRIQLQQLLPNDQQKQNTLLIWKQVQQLPVSTLNNLSQNSSNNLLAGWASLALLMQQYGSASTQQLATQLNAWREKYTDHPANQLLSASFQNNTVNTQKTTHVALLMPLEGPFKDQADAVVNGFLVAYHSLPTNQQPIIKIYDTNNTHIIDLYHQAVTEGAQFIIGPLTKPDVQTIIDQGSCQVPTLLLNYTTADNQLPANCYEFGISPINEANEAATRAWLDNYDQAVIISPKGEWGQSIADSFKNQWQILGGRVIAELDFEDSKTLAQQIALLMGVEQSNQRATQLKRLLGQPIKWLPRRRGDIGMIFINATNAQARQIIPLLKFNFSGNTPIFATSLIYNGIPSPATDRDLNGVRFLVMPWSTQNSSEQAELQRLWPTNFHNNSKLYALGIDSLRLMLQLPRMQLFPQNGISGVTGTLTLEPTQQITQQMLWAKFVDGTPALLTKKAHHGGQQ